MNFKCFDFYFFFTVFFPLRVILPGGSDGRVAAALPSPHPNSSILVWRIPWTEEPGRLHTVQGVAEVHTA